MSTFIVAPCSTKSGDKLEPVRINMDDVGDYRKWKNDGTKDQTVFFFKKITRKKRLIADISVSKVDEALGISSNGSTAEKVEEEAEVVTKKKK